MSAIGQAPAAAAEDLAFVAFLRHGRTAWNRAHRLQGRSDQPLDAEGRAEMAALRPPPPWDQAEIVTSPLARAQETAALIAPGAPTRIDPDFIEMDFGVWEGRSGAALQADPASGFRDIETWGLDFRPGGGERVSALLARVAAGLRRIAAARRRTLVVAHIGVIRAALALAHDWRFEGAPPFRVKRGRLHLLALDRAGAPRPAGEPLRLAPAPD